MLAVGLNAAAGRGAILLGVLVCAFGIVVTVAGIRQGNTRVLRSTARYSYVAFAAALIAFVVMERALITRDFSLAYVQQVGSRSTPGLYNVTALWSALLPPFSFVMSGKFMPAKGSPFAKLKFAVDPI